MFVGDFLDKSDWESVLKDLVKTGKYLNVGFLEGRKYPEEALTGTSKTKKGAVFKTHDVYIAQVAFQNEFGTEHIPARPFMKNTVLAHGKEWIDAIAGFLKAGQYDASKFLETVGLIAVADMQAMIESCVPPPNAPATVAMKIKKGRAAPNHTLVDSGEMQRNVWYEIKDFK